MTTNFDGYVNLLENQIAGLRRQLAYIPEKQKAETAKTSNLILAGLSFLTYAGATAAVAFTGKTFVPLISALGLTAAFAANPVFGAIYVVAIAVGLIALVATIFFLHATCKSHNQAQATGQKIKSAQSYDKNIQFLIDKQNADEVDRAGSVPVNDDSSTEGSQPLYTPFVDGGSGKPVPAQSQDFVVQPRDLPKTATNLAAQYMASETTQLIDQLD